MMHSAHPVTGATTTIIYAHSVDQALLVETRLSIQVGCNPEWHTQTVLALCL